MGFQKNHKIIDFALLELKLWSFKTSDDILYAGVVSGGSVCHVINSHEIAGCGVDFSLSGRGLASGDLAGNVWVTEGAKVKTVFKCNVSPLTLCGTMPSN